MKTTREELIRERQKRERSGGVRYVRNAHRDRLRRKAERDKYNHYACMEREYA